MVHLDETPASLAIGLAELEAASFTAQRTRGFQGGRFLGLDELSRTFTHKMSTSEDAPFLRFLDAVKLALVVGCDFQVCLDCLGCPGQPLRIIGEISPDACCLSRAQTFLALDKEGQSAGSSSASCTRHWGCGNLTAPPLLSLIAD